MNRQSGFTLLEVLVVISLLGVLTALAGTLLVNANRIHATANHFSTRVDQVRAAQQYLRHALGQALPLGAGPRVAAPPLFVGEAQRLVFQGPLPDSIGGGVLQQQLALDGQRLVVTFTRLDGQGTQGFDEPQVLLDGVRQLALSYHGRSPLGQDTGWRPDWPWPDRLPRAVRIAATLAGRVPWVTLQVNLRLDLASEPASL